ncbi:MAG: helix-turn-helix transcriptional regulator [Gemmatimonadetes bacterium]|nr:helix-turn-helix transcriptional regulator [Gemmatimonadota bacterium]MYE16876.1 helix-turn-helix transcriptional regulator [Gemmatimonadota bacterium]MYG23161.1 helix-turn-helix transcriptional regulator [Gemmatimonadota bacterium]MYJ38757.1 helix-turn-helix transcriptional regulator [Gemmatimonadota bacterium]
MTPAEIGSIVRAARRAQGLRQDQLAGAAGVGVRFLSELERGKPTVRLEKVITVLDTLGCTLRVEMPWGEAASAVAASGEEAMDRSAAPAGGSQRPAWSTE